MKPIEITRTDYMADEMWAFYKKERDGRMKERYQAIAIMLEGNNAREAADVLHLSRNTTWEWATAYNDAGFDGLKRKSPPGRKSRLTDDEKELLKVDIQKNPRDLGYEFSIWDGKSVSHHIEQRFSKLIGVRGVQKMLRKLGFSLQRPELKPAKANPVKQQEFKDNIKKR